MRFNAIQGMSNYLLYTIKTYSYYWKKARTSAITSLEISSLEKSWRRKKFIQN